MDASRARGLVQRLLERRAAMGSSRLLLAVAAAVFVTASVVAYAQLPDVESSVRWHLLALLAVVGTCGTLAANALEYAVLASLLDRRVTSAEASRVSVLSSAANLLPLPGSILVRANALRRKGVAYRDLATATALVALVFVGIAGLLTGGLLTLTRTWALAAVLLVVGASALGLGIGLVRFVPRRTQRTRALALLAVVEFGSIVVAGLRFFLALAALGHSVTLEQVAALTAAGVAGTAIAIVPSGLGVRELVAAGLSPLVSLSAAVGLFAGAVDRVVATASLAAVAGAMLVFDRRLAAGAVDDESNAGFTRSASSD